MPGPPIRTDLVEVYVFRRSRRASSSNGSHQNPKSGAAAGVTFLQMRRAASSALGGTWQPVIGHIEEGETAAQTALRELREETRYGPSARGVLGFWQLEQPNTYFLHARQCLMMSPCFAAEAAPDVPPALNDEHDAARWVPRDRVDRSFLWPGQRQAIRQIVADLLPPHSPVESILRVPVEM